MVTFRHMWTAHGNVQTRGQHMVTFRHMWTAHGNVQTHVDSTW